MIPNEEISHHINVLEQTKKALEEKTASKLRELSNKTIHCATSHQDSASITIAVIVYALSKLIERGDYSKIKNWKRFVKKFNNSLDLAIASLKQNNYKEYEEHIRGAREILTSKAINLTPYIQDVLKKSSINKASKIYEHGLSLELTAELLGITIWELSEYIGQKIFDAKQEEPTSVKKRIRTVIDFFEK